MLQENNIYLGDMKELIKQSPPRAYIITDPPFNVGYKYEAKDDNRTREEYQEFFIPMRGASAVIINYPEIMIRDKNIKDKRVSPEVRLYDWWEIQQVKNVSEDKTEHPCQMPIEVMKRIILTTTNEGDLILEPFMGSGTTCLAAYDLKRRYIGIEKEPKYYEIAKKRIEQFQAQTRLF